METETTNIMKTHHEELYKIEILLKRAKSVVPEGVKELSPFPLSSVSMLDLGDCSLEELPLGFERSFPNISILFLSKNRFRQMPAVIGACPNLQMVAFRSNEMETIDPEALQPQLRWLILTNNRISTIPDTIGRCELLQKCILSGNKISCLPRSIENCRRLELIRLASNQLTEPPMTLLKLPKLAWIGLSDNPYLRNLASAHEETLPTLNDVDETHGDVLGQGAGGVTRKVWYNGQFVAVKTFVGAMTSDGLPSEERRITCTAAALNCTALINVLGQTRCGSLVMEYLDGYHAIADPPSFESCSRDVYPPDRKVTMQQGIIIINDLLYAMTMLHKGGICHGDFYGHNILVHRMDSSRVRLTDFGAAFFYDKEDRQKSFWLEKIELRAFAIFVEEVIVRLEGARAQVLTDLANRCRSEENYPLFDSVFIWWKQMQLSAIALEFGEGVPNETLDEEKEP